LPAWQPSSTRIARTTLTALEPDGISWRASSYSAGYGGCVEVAPAPDGVRVRDSKDRDGSVLTVPTTAWHSFRTTVTC
jgi:hypothetical protein